MKPEVFEDFLAAAMQADAAEIHERRCKEEEREKMLVSEDKLTGFKSYRDKAMTLHRAKAICACCDRLVPKKDLVLVANLRTCGRAECADRARRWKSFCSERGPAIL